MLISHTHLMKKIIALLWILIGATLLSFIGVKNHPDEQNNRMVIIKHRPSLKLEFYSPLESADIVKDFESLNEAEKKEEPHAIRLDKTILKM